MRQPGWHYKHPDIILLLEIPSVAIITITLGEHSVLTAAQPFCLHVRVPRQHHLNRIEMYLVAKIDQITRFGKLGCSISLSAGGKFLRKSAASSPTGNSNR